MASNLEESLLPKFHSFHIEYVENFKALSQEAQRYLIFETYRAHLACLRGLTFEDWIEIFYNPNLISLKIILLKDKFSINMPAGC